MAAREGAEAPVVGAHVAQRVLDHQQPRADQPVDDLIGDGRLPRDPAAVEPEGAAALAHDHGVAVVVAEPGAEEVGQVADDAGMADQPPERLVPGVQGPGRYLALVVLPEVEEGVLARGLAPDVVVVQPPVELLQLGGPEHVLDHQVALQVEQVALLLGRVHGPARCPRQ